MFNCQSFPSPQQIKRNEDTAWHRRNTKHMLGNLQREFNKQAEPSAEQQTIRIGHNAKGGPALWVRNFSENGTNITNQTQVVHAIREGNSQLLKTGWRIVDIVPVEVTTTNQYKLNSWWNNYDYGLDHDKQTTPKPMMPALDVVMEYVGP